jgi:hypothetical protein
MIPANILTDSLIIISEVLNFRKEKPLNINMPPAIVQMNAATKSKYFFGMPGFHV